MIYRAAVATKNLSHKDILDTKIFLDQNFLEGGIFLTQKYFVPKEILAQKISAWAQNYLKAAKMFKEQQLF